MYQHVALWQLHGGVVGVADADESSAPSRADDGRGAGIGIHGDSFKRNISMAVLPKKKEKEKREKRKKGKKERKEKKQSWESTMGQYLD
jgi:hypothetical protein